jgi:hypothetical protein
LVEDESPFTNQLPIDLQVDHMCISEPLCVQFSSEQ